jgi:hypothetical protein
MFDLSGGRRATGGGRESLPAPQPARQRRSNDKDSLDTYSMISSPARSVGGGPPARIIEFTLGRNTEQLPPSVTQQETHSATATSDENEGVTLLGGNPAAIPPGGPGAHPNTVNLMAQMQGGSATATVTTPYSGFEEAIKKLGLGTESSIAQDLKWQKEVTGDAQKISQFKEVVGGLQDFRTYLFMKPGSAFATVLHSPMKFVAISKAMQHLQGRFVGFVGDRSSTKDPISIVLPQQKLWSWETKTVSSDAVALATYYDEDPTCRGKLWTPDQANSGEWMPVKAPLLLAIPLVLFRAIREEGKPLMPHKIHGLTTTIIDSSADVAKACTDWNLILAWCILEAQQNTYGNSHLSLAVEAVTEGDNTLLKSGSTSVSTQRLSPAQSRGSRGTRAWGGVALNHDPAHVSAIMATEVGKGVTLGLQAAGHLHRNAAQLGGGYEMEASKGYTKDNIAAIMGFAGVYNSHNFPDIWELFNATKGKNMDVYRHHLYA